MAHAKKRKSFASQRRRSLLRNHRWLIALAGTALAALFLLGQFGDAGIASWWKLRAEESRLEKEVADLEAGNAHRKEQLQLLADDPFTLEKIAREKHDLQRADEEVLTVLESTEKAKKDD